MATPKKKTKAKTPTKLKDLKAKKDVKGGMAMMMMMMPTPRGGVKS